MGILKDAFPQLRRVAFLWDPTNPALVARHKEVQAAARMVGIAVQSSEVRRPDELESALAAIVRERAGAVLPATSLARQYRRQLVEFTMKHRLPIMHESAVDVREVNERTPRFGIDFAPGSGLAQIEKRPPL